MPFTLETNRILGLLKEKHQDDSWAYFDNLRTCTGASMADGYIDAFAVGLWKKNDVCIAYEVKSSVQDFRKDIEKFKSKQKSALRNSNQFYYVCPTNLIKENEIPLTTGLMYAHKSGLRIKKVAPIREMPNGQLEMVFVKSLLRSAFRKVKDVPLWKYQGKEITDKEILKIAEEKGYSQSRFEIESSAKTIAAKKRLGSYHAIKKLKDAFRGGIFGYGEPFTDDNIDKIIEKITEHQNNSEVKSVKRIKKMYNDLRIEVDNMGKILGEI